MMQTRVVSGIPGLDELIEGGFQRNRSILVCGDTGTGKTIFGLQFLVEGAKRGEPGVLVAVDEKPGHLIEDARRFGWDLAGASEKKLMSLLDASPYFTSWHGKNGLDARQVANDLAQQARSIGAKRLVIDSLTSLIPPDAQGVYDFLRSLIFSLEDNLGCTLLFTARTFPGDNSPGVHRIIEQLAAGIVDLRIGPVEREAILGRSLFIPKMRGTRVDLVPRPFDIFDDRGLVLRQL